MNRKDGLNIGRLIRVSPQGCAPRAAHCKSIVINNEPGLECTPGMRHKNKEAFLAPSSAHQQPGRIRNLDVDLQERDGIAPVHLDLHIVGLD